MQRQHLGAESRLRIGLAFKCQDSQDELERAQHVTIIGPHYQRVGLPCWEEGKGCAAPRGARNSIAGSGHVFACAITTTVSAPPCIAHHRAKGEQDAQEAEREASCQHGRNHRLTGWVDQLGETEVAIDEVALFDGGAAKRQRNTEQDSHLHQKYGAEVRKY
uniref:Uncharacterized protein n=1 Tax=Globodera rostochiensis TaxID=31243 RepID=A0A914HNH3_GLORO